MYNITLICTRHREVGKCNSTELYKIIADYKPNVIFEELTPVIHDECYRINSFGLTKRTTLETTAIKMYREHYDVIHLPMLITGMHDDFRLMHLTIDDISYRDLVEKLVSLEREFGYQFLNSADCEQLFEEIKALEKSILGGNGIFRRAYQCVDNYENDMIKNIYQYSLDNEYNEALMFIGAAHRKSIVKKINENNEVNALKLNWTFYYN